MTRKHECARLRSLTCIFALSINSLFVFLYKKDFHFLKKYYLHVQIVLFDAKAKELYIYILDSFDLYPVRS